MAVEPRYPRLCELAAQAQAAGALADRAVMARILDLAAREAQGPVDFRRATLAAIAAGYARALPESAIAAALGVETAWLHVRRKDARALIGASRDFAQQVARLSAAIEVASASAAVAAIGGADAR